MLSSSGRQVNVKSSTFIQMTVRGDNTIMILDYFLHNRQSNACSMVFCFTMQALEEFKYFFAEKVLSRVKLNLSTTIQYGS